jgi:energy-converting hydrogenase Eha subunit B
MIPLMFFGLIGGIVCAIIASPYGVVAALLAYMFGGSVCALIPGLLRYRGNKAVADADFHSDPAATTSTLGGQQEQTKSAA